MTATNPPLHIARSNPLRIILLAVTCLSVCPAVADSPATMATQPEPVIRTLPQRHECQRQLRAFMATLTENDFEHGVAGLLNDRATHDIDPEYLYRNHLYTQMRQPLVGSKDSVPAVQAPPSRFLLSNIERSDGIRLPPVWPETLISFVQWDYPGNPFHNNRGLKLRAFAGAVVQMTMFLNYADSIKGEGIRSVRPDTYGYNPVIWAASYPGFKDVLPPDIQQAYESCLKLAGERFLASPLGDGNSESNLLGPLGLVYISRAVNDPEFTRKVQAYIRPLFTDDRHFHPAGYWDDRGGIDTGFGGMAGLYATWIALMTDWPFARAAVERAYRLRGHLILPEPDGSMTGPSHFNSRLGCPASQEQWGYARAGAAMFTDEAAWSVKTPTAEQLAKAPAVRAQMINTTQLRIAPKPNLDYFTQEELTGDLMRPWTLRPWMTYRFPISVNPSYEFYRKGALAHRKKLEGSNSPMLKSPFLRGENFIRAFEKDFFVARQPGFAAIVHSGTIGAQTFGEKKIQYVGPMGLGGGQLSAFWTPATGPVLLGLRSGMSIEKSHDRLDAWRTWPIHAISGVTADEKVFTSARNARPKVLAEVRTDSATIRVSGPLVALKIPKARTPGAGRLYDEPLEGKADYTRTFTISGDRVRVETTVRYIEKDSLAELYETLPVYLGAGQEQKSNANAKIEFQVHGQWALATEAPASAQAIRITRFGGAVIVTFDRPYDVRLAPADWTDTWLNKYATCRNVLVDLLGGSADESHPPAERIVRYEISPAAKP